MRKSIFSAEAEVVRSAIVEMREKAGLTQRQLAERIDSVRSLVARIELGERRVDLPEFHQICRACGQDAAKLAASLMRRLDRTGRKPGKA